MKKVISVTEFMQQNAACERSVLAPFADDIPARTNSVVMGQIITDNPALKSIMKAETQQGYS